MDRVAHTAGCSIYCGDEIDAAADRSRLSNDVLSARPRGRFHRIARLTRDVRNARFGDWLPRTCVVTGTERDSGEPMAIQIIGTLRVVDFCASAILGSNKYEYADLTPDLAERADVLVSDHPFARPMLRWRRSFRAPPWVRQELPISRCWTDSLGRLRSSLRKEIRRLLRRHQYSIQLSTGQPAIRDYYSDLHIPYVVERFGNSAIYTSEKAFLDQCEHMTRVDLLHDQSVVAASLVECKHSRLAIRSNSMRLGKSELRGRADVLDYFCLLIAHLHGCRVLDFGLSRAHLDNGSFRYKAKWGAVLAPAGLIKAPICITPLRRTDATLAFLRRNYFLQHAHDRYTVRVLFDGQSNLDELRNLAARHAATGLSAVELAYDPRSEPPDFGTESGLASHRIADVRDPFSVVRVAP